MPTNSFKIEVQHFLRRVGEGNISITLANPTVISSHFNPQPQRFTDIELIYDYFLLAGQELFKAIERITKGEVTRLLPSFFKRTQKTLTAGSWTPDIKIERIIDPISVEVTSGVMKMAYKVPDAILEDIIQSVGMRTISSETAGYYLSNNIVKVLPTTSLSITFNYIQSVPRLTLSSVDVDIWPDNYMKMLTDGAVMIAKGDTNETGLEQFYFQKIQGQLQKEQISISHQKNLLLEQE